MARQWRDRHHGARRLRSRCHPRASTPAPTTTSIARSAGAHRRGDCAGQFHDYIVRVDAGAGIAVSVDRIRYFSFDNERLTEPAGGLAAVAVRSRFPHPAEHRGRRQLGRPERCGRVDLAAAPGDRLRAGAAARACPDAGRGRPGRSASARKPSGRGSRLTQSMRSHTGAIASLLAFLLILLLHIIPGDRDGTAGQPATPLRATRLSTAAGHRRRAGRRGVGGRAAADRQMAVVQPAARRFRPAADRRLGRLRQRRALLCVPLRRSRARPHQDVDHPPRQHLERRLGRLQPRRARAPGRPPTTCWSIRAASSST